MDNILHFPLPCGPCINAIVSAHSVTNYCGLQRKKVKSYLAYRSNKLSNSLLLLSSPSRVLLPYPTLDVGSETKMSEAKKRWERR
jgi:hypothetical protein